MNRGMLWLSSMHKCRSCENYISKQEKYCKECNYKRKEKKSKINPKFLTRGEVRYSGYRSLYDK